MTDHRLVCAVNDHADPRAGKPWGRTHLVALPHLSMARPSCVITPRSGRAEFDALLASSAIRLADTTAVGGKT